MSMTMGVYGRPSMGKTTLLLQMAERMAGDGKSLFVSFEAFRNTLEKRCRTMGICTENIDIQDSLFSIDEIRDYVSRNGEINAVFLDYIQLLGSHNDNAMKLKEIGVPVIFASQLGRQIDYREDHRPVLSDIDIIDNRVGRADAAITIWRPYEPLEGRSVYEIIEDYEDYTELKILRGSIYGSECIIGRMDTQRRRFEFEEEAWDSILRIMSL